MCESGDAGVPGPRRCHRLTPARRAGARLWSCHPTPPGKPGSQTPPCHRGQVAQAAESAVPRGGAGRGAGCPACDPFAALPAPPPPRPAPRAAWPALRSRFRRVPTPGRHGAPVLLQPLLRVACLSSPARSSLLARLPRDWSPAPAQAGLHRAAPRAWYSAEVTPQLRRLILPPEEGASTDALWSQRVTGGAEARSPERPGHLVGTAGHSGPLGLWPYAPPTIPAVLCGHGPSTPCATPSGPQGHTGEWLLGQDTLPHVA